MRSSIACLTFVIPRHRVDLAANMTIMKSGCAPLCCAIEDSLCTFSFWFAAVQFAFGKVQPSDHGRRFPSTLKIIEDHEAWSGKSDLVASFLVPYLDFVAQCQHRKTVAPIHANAADE